MNTVPPSTAVRWAAYLEEARCEVLRYLRLPGFVMPAILFPTVFYLMFAVVLAHGASPDAPRYLIASYGTFGVMSPGLFGFGVSLAMDREFGLLTLKRALPMPPGANMVGKMCMAMLMAGLIAVVMLVLAATAGKVALTAGQCAAFAATEIIGVLPFCALGMLLGTFAKGTSAAGMINLIYLPMSFLSGLWFPLSVMPPIIQQLAVVWPAYHLDRLALSAVGIPQGDLLVHVAVLAAYTVGALALATRRLRRNG